MASMRLFARTALILTSALRAGSAGKRAGSIPRMLILTSGGAGRASPSAEKLFGMQHRLPSPSSTGSIVGDSDGASSEPTVQTRIKVRLIPADHRELEDLATLSFGRPARVRWRLRVSFGHHSWTRAAKRRRLVGSWRAPKEVSKNLTDSPSGDGS